MITYKIRNSIEHNKMVRFIRNISLMHDLIWEHSDLDTVLSELERKLKKENYGRIQQ